MTQARLSGGLGLFLLLIKCSSSQGARTACCHPDQLLPPCAFSRRGGYSHTGVDTIAHWDILLKIDFLSHSSILDRVEIFLLLFTGWRVPVVERAGLAMRSLAKAEPLKTEGCKRDDCFPCTTGGGNCERNGSGYRISCGSCLRAGKKAEYEGETGANGFTRGNEQLSGLRS